MSYQLDYQDFFSSALFAPSMAFLIMQDTNVHWSCGNYDILNHNLHTNLRVIKTAENLFSCFFLQLLNLYGRYSLGILPIRKALEGANKALLKNVFLK